MAEPLGDEGTYATVGAGGDVEAEALAGLSSTWIDEVLGVLSIERREVLLRIVADLAAFAAALRSQATTAPARPDAASDEALARGTSAEKGELPVTAASNVSVPATQVSGPPKRRIRTTLEPIAASLAALSMAGQAGWPVRPW